MSVNRAFGEPLPGWVAPRRPDEVEIRGRHVVLQRLDPARHGDDLWAAYDGFPEIWDYMPVGPFAGRSAFDLWLTGAAASNDPLFYVICVVESGRALGVQSFLRITPDVGTIELGFIALSPALQRTPASTEAFYLMMDWAFAAGYRRFEWKCDAFNLPSRRAAQRLGLSYEGVFRQATIYKSRNRDTAWFATIDKDWPALRAAFSRWLAPTNFDAEGRQRESLAMLTAPLLLMRDPKVAG